MSTTELLEKFEKDPDSLSQEEMRQLLKAVESEIVLRKRPIN